jgi:predicted CoA-binding protein
LGCKHPLDICNLLIKKDIIDAEKYKSLTNLKPKHDLVDIYRANLRAEAEKNEAKRPPVI